MLELSVPDIPLELVWLTVKLKLSARTYRRRILKIPLELNYGRNLFFTRREEGLKYINTFLRAWRMERAGTPIVMYGTGGIGKTQLVREFLYTHAPDFTSVI